MYRGNNNNIVSVTVRLMNSLYINNNGFFNNRTEHCNILANMTVMLVDSSAYRLY